MKGPLLTDDMKRFLDWIKVKEKRHSLEVKVPYVSEGQIWWTCLGENIGFEINGKNEFFSRPVVIIKKLTQSFYLVAPTTTQTRVGTWYVRFKQRNGEATVCLHQIRTIDYKRLRAKLGMLDDADFKRIKEAFNKLYKLQ